MNQDPISQKKMNKWEHMSLDSSSHKRMKQRIKKEWKRVFFEPQWFM